VMGSSGVLCEIVGEGVCPLRGELVVCGAMFNGTGCVCRVKLLTIGYMGIV